MKRMVILTEILLPEKSGGRISDCQEEINF